MSKLMAAGLLVLVMCVPVPADAYGKITVDPNAGGARDSDDTLSNADITQKVTYEAKRKTVVSILADLSKMTGVKLKAGYNNEDWQVRDRRMNIFAKDIPLSNLMNSIARVMKFSWSKSERDGVISYRLYMDRQTLLGEERQRYIIEERLKQRQADARQEFVSGLKATIGMPYGELQSLATQSPYIYAMTKMGWADLFARMFAEVPGAREAFLNGQELSIDIGSTSSAVQQALANMQYGFGEWGSLDDATLTINNYGNPSGSHLGDIGKAVIKLGEHTFLTNFLDPASDHAKAIAGIMGAQGQLGPDASADASELGRFVDLLHRAQAREQVNLDEPLIEHPSDPVLSTKVKMNSAGEDFPDTLCVLAKASGFAIVSDSFYRKLGVSFPQEEIEVRTVLDRLESACYYNWERHGSTIELHDRGWFKKRAAQIPDAWLEAWRNTLVNNGFLDIDDLSQMAMLTADQFSVNVFADDVLGKASLFHVAFDYKDMLRLYAKLNKQQRNRIFTQQGLMLDFLTDDQWSAVEALLKAIPGCTHQGGLALVGTRNKDGKQITYIINITTSSGDTTCRQYKITCPVYNAPANPGQ